MIELKPCPFCPDGVAGVVTPGGQTADGFPWIAWGHCSGCGATAAPGLGDTEQEALDNAAKNWNTRWERTCHVTHRNDFKSAFGEHSIWYECGASVLIANGTQEPVFCPGCGAKVVEE